MFDTKVLTKGAEVASQNDNAKKKKKLERQKKVTNDGQGTHDVDTSPNNTSGVVMRNKQRSNGDGKGKNRRSWFGGSKERTKNCKANLPRSQSAENLSVKQSSFVDDVEVDQHSPPPQVKSNSDEGAMMPANNSFSDVILNQEDDSEKQVKEQTESRKVLSDSRRKKATISFSILSVLLVGSTGLLWGMHKYCLQNNNVNMANTFFVLAVAMSAFTSIFISAGTAILAFSQVFMSVHEEDIKPDLQPVTLEPNVGNSPGPSPPTTSAPPSSAFTDVTKQPLVVGKQTTV